MLFRDLPVGMLFRSICGDVVYRKVTDTHCMIVNTVMPYPLNSLVTPLYEDNIA